MHTTPPSLLEKVRLPGDQDAWTRFVKLYTPLLFAWTRPLGLNEHDAADLVQDVFLTLARKLPEFHYDPQRSFRAWLHVVLRNRWRNWCASRAAANRRVEMEEPAVLDGAAIYEEKEYRQYLVARALELMQAEFQPTTWKACWELVVGERRGSEIAAELGVSVNAVYLAKSRVLRRLRQELQGLLDC